MTTPQIDAVDEMRRSTAESREPGCWFAYYADWSGFVHFADELDCLRHAVEYSMKAAWFPFGSDPMDQNR